MEKKTSFQEVCEITEKAIGKNNNQIDIGNDY